MSDLVCENLSVKYDQHRVLDDFNLSILPGKVTSIIGANGSGKSTLLHTLIRILKPNQGQVLLNGKNLQTQKTTDVAKQMALLPQLPESPAGQTVFELVKLGRYPHQNWLKQWSAEDEHWVNQALEATGLWEIRHQEVKTLSGGQKQRAWIALVLAQNTHTILLDEPINHLDLLHQMEVLNLIKQMNEEHQKTIVIVLHDINLACRYSDHMVALTNGTILAQGPPNQIISETLIYQVFGLHCKLIRDPIYHALMCIPYTDAKVLAAS